MKNYRFLNKPRLCQWLLLTLLLQSCVVFRQTPDIKTDTQQPTWQLVVKLAPGYDYIDLPVFPGYMKTVTDQEGFTSLAPGYEKVTYCGSFKQIQELNDALLTSGMAIRISLWKIGY